MKAKKVLKIARKMFAEVIETFKRAKEFDKAMDDVEKTTKGHVPGFIGIEWHIDRKEVRNSKSEELTVTIEMKSNGTTSNISKQQLLDYVMENWNTIKVN